MTDIDPREAKLPVWVREKLESQRRLIQSLERAVDAVKSEHAGSNVRLVDHHHNILKPTGLPRGSHVEFDSKWGKISVGHGLHGRVEIQGDNILILRMAAGNALTVELED